MLTLLIQHSVCVKHRFANPLTGLRLSLIARTVSTIVVSKRARVLVAYFAESMGRDSYSLNAESTACITQPPLPSS